VIARILDNVAGRGAVSNAGGVLTIQRNATDSANFSAQLVNDEILSSIQLSEAVDRVSIVHSGAVVTLSDQPAPLQVGRQIAYLARISATSGDSGQVSLEPDTITEGLTMVVLPRILDRDRVMLRLAVSITDAQEPFAEFGEGGSGGDGTGLVIQLPEVNTTGFLQNAFMHSGETMVLAGFERKQDSSSESGMPGGLWTGGDRATNRSRNITVLLLTTEILPEDGMTVINN